MFTVIFGLDASGNSSTRKPFDFNVYSLMPSTDGPTVKASLAAAVAVAGACARAAAPVRSNAVAKMTPTNRTVKEDTRD